MATFGLRHFPVKSDVFLCFFGRVKGSLRVLTRSRVVQGGAGKPRAPDRWPESSGRGLENDFLIEAFFCQVCSFQVVWGISRWLQEVSSCVPGGIRRSGEAQIGGWLRNALRVVLAVTWLTVYRQSQVVPGLFQSSQATVLGL